MSLLWPDLPCITSCPCGSTHVAYLGSVEYSATLQAMQHYTQNRGEDSADQIWFVEHPSVYTRGRSSSSKDILHDLPYPIVDTDRGGQITYHGPGQLVVYYLIDINRLAHIQLRGLIDDIESTIRTVLAYYQLTSYSDAQARGVYVDDGKIASIGLRYTKRGTYHGFALNACLDLSPFTHINPCGRAQKMVSIQQLSHQDMSHVIPVTYDALQSSDLLTKRSLQLSSCPLGEG